jgi:hypothetical protein
MPFPGTEKFADAEFLVGGNRPTTDLPVVTAKVSDAATPVIRND